MNDAAQIKQFLAISLAWAALGIVSPLHAQETVKGETDFGTEVMAYGRFVPEREDDFTWENDVVAFRVYGPSSGGKGQVSGVDAWLKRVSYPIIDKWYAEHLSGKSYHTDHGEGYDPYHVGDSRGVGGTALWIEGKPWPAGKFQEYEILQNSGSVVEFVLRYEWETPLGKVNEQKTVSLALGDQLYQVQSLFKLNGEPAALPIAIGLTTHDGAAQVNRDPNLGWISTWEIIDEYGLGTAVLVAPDKVEDVVEVNSDTKDASHAWLITSTNDSGELSFRAGFAWEAAGEIASHEEWNQYMNDKATR